jgi:hypothetical protein
MARVSVTRFCGADGSVVGVTQGGDLDIEFGQKNAGDYILFSAPTRASRTPRPSRGDSTLSRQGRNLILGAMRNRAAHQPVQEPLAQVLMDLQRRNVLEGDVIDEVERIDVAESRKVSAPRGSAASR